MGYPKIIYSFILGGTNTKEDTGGNSEKNYWRVIQFLQKRFANTMNTQLWIPYFGVRIVFDDPFAMDDIQKETALMNKLNNLKLIDDIVRSKGKEIKVEEFTKLINMDSEQFTDYENPMDSMDINSTLDKQPSKNDVEDTDAKKGLRNRKKLEQENLKKQGSPNGTSGVGKEWNTDADIELKELKNIEIKQSNVEDVPLKTLIKLYQEDKVIRSGKPPRMFMRESGDIVSFKYMSDDFVYRTVTQKDMVSDVDMMNLSVNLYRL